MEQLSNDKADNLLSQYQFSKNKISIDLDSTLDISKQIYQILRIEFTDARYIFRCNKLIIFTHCRIYTCNSCLEYLCVNRVSKNNYDV